MIRSLSKLTCVSISKAIRNPLARRVGLNAIGYGYSQIVTLAIQFVQVPIFLKYWGAQRYGEWLVLTGIPTMLALLDFGVTQASGNNAIMAAGARDWIGVRRSLQTATAFTSAVGLLLVIAALLVNVALNWTQILDLELTSRQEANGVFALMVASLAIQMQFGITDAWFKVMGRSALGAFLSANRRASDVLVALIALNLGAGPVLLALWLLIVRIGIFIILLFAANSLSPQPIFDRFAASWNDLRHIFRPAIACLGFPIAQTVTLQGGVQILNQLAGPTAVVGFTMMRTLMRLLIQIGIVLNNALKPELSRLAGEGRVSELENFTARFARVTAAMGLIAYCVLIIAGPWIVRYWSKEAVVATRWMLALVGLHAFLNVLWYVRVASRIAMNRHVLIASCYCIGSIASLLVWITFPEYVDPFLGASLLLAVPELIMLLVSLVPTLQYGFSYVLASSGKS